MRARWNRRELLWLLSLLVAIAAATSALVVGLALVAGARGFVAGAVAVLAVAVGAALAAARQAGRQWLRPARAPLRIDRQAGLRGRLATLVELDDAAGTEFFLPLLAAQTLQQLPAWAPARLVPRLVPRGPVAAALAASGGLALLLAGAPRLAPRPPERLATGAPITGPVAVAPRGSTPRVTASVTPEAGGAREPQAADAGGAVGGARSSSLDRLADELQARIRDGLWGERWRQAAEATARAEQERRARQGEDEAAGPDEPFWEAAHPAGRSGARRSGSKGQSATPVAAAERSSPAGTGPRAGGARGTGDGDSSGAHEAVPGAGSGSSPELFGAPSEAAHTESEPFQLGIAARTRASFAGSRRPSGDAPPAEPDSGPRLAPGQEPECPMPRVTVPAAYESVVRRIFARRGPEEEAP